MSFPIVLYTNNSAANVVDKNISEVVTLTGVLRNGSSITDPVISVEISGDSFPTNGVNYLYIALFGRYYYVTNIISVNNTLWEIHCHVDVLMSFKDGIRNQTAIVARQEIEYNLMLDDGIFMCYQDPLIQTKLFSVAGPFETQEFVLIVAGS